MRRTLAALVGLALLGCQPAPSPDPDDSTAGDVEGPAGDDDELEPTDPAGIGVFGECVESADCAEGLSCAADWRGTGRSYCLEPCTGETCDAGSRCAEGHCLLAAAPYAEWTVFHACGADALAFTRVPTAPPRCTPLCDLAGAACPALPADLAGTPPACTPLGVGDLYICTTQVAVGELCDEGPLRCAGTERPDTDPTLEADGTTLYDPGALACLPVGAENRCLRVCSTSGGDDASLCPCPGGDPMCADPADPGVAWECHSWAGPIAALTACVAVEGCTGAECADNTLSGLTSCAPTPYAEPEGTSICQRP